MWFFIKRLDKDIRNEFLVRSAELVIVMFVSALLTIQVFGGSGGRKETRYASSPPPIETKGK